MSYLKNTSTLKENDIHLFKGQICGNIETEGP